MSEQNLRFSSSCSTDTGTFRLLELPNDILKLLDGPEPPRQVNTTGVLFSSTQAQCSLIQSLTIKGHATEDAVLCTSDKTYAIRSVTLSNSVLVVTRPPDAMDIVIRDQVQEILELLPAVPKLHKLTTLLRGLEYDEGQEDEDQNVAAKRRGYSYDDAERDIQASEAELASAIKLKHILILNGHLRPIAPAYLDNILELLLNSLISLGLSHTSASVDDLCETLADDHEVARQVSRQVISWFGTVTNGKWTMDVDGVVKEIGIGILRDHKDEPLPEDEFMTRWEKAVGDAFESAVDLALLSGNYLSTPSATLTSTTHMLNYLPSSSLPLDPAARFADLFLTRPRWLATEIAPFLSEIAVDGKERDKLLLKFARATTEGKDVYYTTRAKYNG